MLENSIMEVMNDEIVSGSVKEGRSANNRRKPKKRNAFAELQIRKISFFLAIVLTLWNFYHNQRVFQKFGIASVNYSFAKVSTFSDLQIYPSEFQELYRERAAYPPLSLPEQPTSWTPKMRSEMHQKFQRHNRESVYALLLHDGDNETNSDNDEPNMDTALSWGYDFEFIGEHVRKRHKQGLYEFHSMRGEDFETEKESIAYRSDPVVIEAAWGNTTLGVPKKPRVIWEHNLCHAFQHAKLYANFSTPHVLITHVNENWGTLSSEVPNRTTMWGDVLKNLFGEHDGFDCDPIELKELYLDSPNTLAVFTTQHQSIFDHPKVHSIPIGIQNSMHGGIQRMRFLRYQKTYKESRLENNKNNNRTRSNDPIPRDRLLMISNSPTGVRRRQIDAVIDNFAKAGVNVSNTFSEDDLKRYLYEMSRSKFILCPSGMGWDTYRIWEAITMGAIPVIERYKTRYEVLTYPEDSGRRSKVIRTLKKGEMSSLAGFPGKLQSNASIEVVEYDDGWRRTLDDLPVVWIDAEFGDVAPPGEESNSKNYLTPQLLEREYDAIAAKMETFRYEKLTSVYWLRFLESFVLLSDPSKVVEGGLRGPTSFESLSEQETWQAAIESLSPIFNNHTILPIRLGEGGWAGWKE